MCGLNGPMTVRLADIEAEGLTHPTPQHLPKNKTSHARINTAGLILKRRLVKLVRVGIKKIVNGLQRCHRRAIWLFV